jgi:ubiquitin C-terminal hydrolase
MVNHEGSLTMGHYTALVKRDDWFVYDDSRCYRSKLNGKNAYLLFYQRVQ